MYCYIFIMFSNIFTIGFSDLEYTRHNHTETIFTLEYVLNCESISSNNAIDNYLLRNSKN